jgi:hypothetical protein
MLRQWAVYLPRWVPWFVGAVAAPAWIWFTYWALVTQAAERDAVAGWTVGTFVLAAVLVLLFLMGYRAIPAYVIRTGPVTRGAPSPPPAGAVEEHPFGPARHVSIELTERQREQIRAIVGRDTDRLRMTVDQLNQVCEPAALATEEHLHDLWVVLGLGEE